MPSFGEELRRERELREISLREISEATKVNMRFLEALERNEFSDLPGGVFNKGYVRAYCQHIGVDPEAMINAYLLEQRSQEQSGAGMEGSGLLRGRSQAARARSSDGGKGLPRVRRPVVAVVAAIVVTLVLIVVIWSATRGDDGAEPAGDRAPSSTAAAAETGP